MADFEKMAVELLQIPYSNKDLREAQMDKMYAAWRGENQQQYQIPYRMDFWANMFSRHLTARGLLHNIPQEELQEFFINNLYNSKQMHGYVDIQVEHKHTIRKTPSGWFEIYENKLNKKGENTGRMLSQFTDSQDGLRGDTNRFVRSLGIAKSTFVLVNYADGNAPSMFCCDKYISDFHF